MDRRRASTLESLRTRGPPRTSGNGALLPRATDRSVGRLSLVAGSDEQRGSLVERTIAPSAAASATGALLEQLDAEQRAAAMLPDGPAQVIAPIDWSPSPKTLVAHARCRWTGAMPEVAVLLAMAGPLLGRSRGVHRARRRRQPRDS